MKLFYYFSLTGNLDKVSEILNKDNIEIRKVETIRKFPKKMFPLMMTGGFLAGINAKTKLKNFNKDTDGFDEIIIGSPIWNGRISSPINYLLKNIDLNDKNITFIFTAGSGEGPKALKKVNKLYPKAKVIFLKEPKKYNEELEKVKEL